MAALARHVTHRSAKRQQPSPTVITTQRTSSQFKGPHFRIYWKKRVPYSDLDILPPRFERSCRRRKLDASSDFNNEHRLFNAITADSACWKVERSSRFLRARSSSSLIIFSHSLAGSITSSRLFLKFNRAASWLSRCIC